MRLFHHHEDIEVVVEEDTPTIWPDDSLSDIDDDAFARAIADGRKKEQDAELIDA